MPKYESKWDNFELYAVVSKGRTGYRLIAVIDNVPYWLAKGNMRKLAWNRQRGYYELGASDVIYSYSFELESELTKEEFHVKVPGSGR